MGAIWCCYVADDDDAEEAHVALVRTRGGRGGGSSGAAADPHGIADPLRGPALSVEDVVLVGAPTAGSAAAKSSNLRARKRSGSASSSSGSGEGAGVKTPGKTKGWRGAKNASSETSAAIMPAADDATAAAAIEDENQGKLAVEEEKEEAHLQLVSVGIIGTGRSSTINTLLNSSSACKVSGGQLRGTRGFAVVEKRVAEPLPGHRGLELDYIDSEGLRRDKNVDAGELETHLVMLARAMSQLPGARVSHIVFTLDLEDRQNAPTVLNLLTLIEAFRDVRERCFLCMTKWNSNAVQAEWNTDLREYSRANRRAKSTQALSGAPPGPAQMRQRYLDYLATSFKPKTEEVAREKLERLLAFFGDRVFWAYNLDSLQLEDREDGELGPMFEEMFSYYRDRAIADLRGKNLSSLPVQDIEVVRAALSGEAADLAARAVQATSALILPA